MVSRSASRQVAVENAVEAACVGRVLRGDTVTVVYISNSVEHTVTLALERDTSNVNEPTVRSGVDLEHDGGNRKQLEIKRERSRRWDHESHGRQQLALYVSEGREQTCRRGIEHGLRVTARRR